MIVYWLSDGMEIGEWYRSKREALKVAQASREPGALELTLEKVWIGDPNKNNVIAYLNGRGFVDKREIVRTWSAVEYSVEGEGSGDWAEADRVTDQGMMDYRGVPHDQIWGEEPGEPIRETRPGRFRIVEAK